MLRPSRGLLLICVALRKPVEVELAGVGVATFSSCWLLAMAFAGYTYIGWCQYPTAHSGLELLLNSLNLGKLHPLLACVFGEMSKLALNISLAAWAVAIG